MLPIPVLAFIFTWALVIISVIAHIHTLPMPDGSTAYIMFSDTFNFGDGMMFLGAIVSTIGLTIFIARR
jgi:hypothetical protein